MIFFRKRTVQVKILREGDEYLLLGKLKATYSAPVNELSGMTVNLKDVDIWINRAKEAASAVAFRNFEEVLNHFQSSLKESSKAFQNVKISIGAVSLESIGSETVYGYRLQSWFRKDKTWVQLTVRLESNKRLSKAWRTRVRHKRWSSADAFANTLRNSEAGIKSIEMQNPVFKTSNKFKT